MTSRLPRSAIVVGWLAAAACGSSGARTRPTLEPVAESALPAAPAPTAAAQDQAPKTDPWADRTDLITPPAAPAATPVTLPKIDRFTLADGLRVIVLAGHDLPVVTMHLVVGAGSEDEPAGKRTTADLAAAMLTHGTNRHSADEIGGTMAFIGGSLSAQADLESTHVVCESLVRDLATCLTLLPEVVIGPNFPEAEMRVVGGQLAGALKQQREDPQSLAGVHLLNLLWGDDHVRGWPRGPEQVAGITRKDLVDWHRTQFVPSNAVLAIAGDVDVAKVRSELERTFQGWRAGKVKNPPRSADPQWKGMRIRLVDRPDLPEAQIAIGELGVAHKDKDYLATLLVNQILGNSGPSSRLATAVRVDRGRGYGARSELERWRQRGMLVVSGVAPTSETVGTVRIILGELAKMRQSGPSDAELTAAKVAITGGYPTAFQSQRDVASVVLAADLHGLSERFVADFPVAISQLSLDEVKDAARRHVDPENVAVVIVGKGDDVAAQLDSAGMKYERVGWQEAVSAKDRKKAAALATADPAKTRAGKELLDAALAAAGGADKLRALSSVAMVGKVQLKQVNQSIDGQWARAFVAPDKLRLEILIPAASQSLVMTIAGASVWQVVGDKVVLFPDELARQAKTGLWREHDLILLRHLEAGTIVQGTGKEKIGKDSFETVVIKQQNGDNETKLYFDGKKRLVRLSYTQGAATAIEDYGDYRLVDGLWFPFHQRAEGGGQSFDVTIESIKVNGAVDPAFFTTPTPQPAPAQPAPAQPAPGK